MLLYWYDLVYDLQSIKFQKMALLLRFCNGSHRLSFYSLKAKTLIQYIMIFFQFKNIQNEECQFLPEPCAQHTVLNV